MSKPRFATLTGIILMAALGRILPHPWNATPLTAMALFGGAQFSNRRTAFVVPLLALILSNLVLGSFYATLPFVVASFMLIVMIGRWIRHRQKAGPMAGAALASSLLFFIVTNFGHWITASDYPKTVAGLMTCYGAAIPFFQNTLVGDLAYTALLFGAFHLAEKKFPSLQEQRSVLS